LLVFLLLARSPPTLLLLHQLKLLLLQLLWLLLPHQLKLLLLQPLLLLLPQLHQPRPTLR
jgi:hypothetical protein